MNKAVISGRLTRDPEARQTNNGKSVSHFTVAVYGGKDHTDFIPCVAWNHTADFVMQYFRKGSPIEIDGSLQSGSYKDKDGKNVYTLDLVCNNVGFPPAPSQKREETQDFFPVPETLDQEEDLPF